MFSRLSLLIYLGNRHMNDYESYGIIGGMCTNTSLENFNQNFFSSNSKLFIINFNIQSFNSKIDEFLTFLDELVRFPDVIILTETWTIGDNFAEIEGYTGFHCNRSMEKRGGGVSVFVKNDLKAKFMKVSMENLPEIEYLHLKMTFKNRSRAPVNIIAVYRPPNPILTNSFFNHIDSILDSLSASNMNQVIAGDFNVCGLHDTPISNQLFNIMRSYSFMPHISTITRYNAYGSSSAIDHIWSNFGHNFESGVFDEIQISDHYVTFVFLPFLIEKTKVITRFRNHSDECITKLMDCLTNFLSFFPTLSAHLNFDEKFDLFFDETMRLYMKCCPIKTKEVSLNNLKKPWISRELIQKI